MSYLTGNILFDGTPKVTDEAVLKVVIEDVTISGNPEVAYSKQLEFDASSIAIFKYMPFELKDFEYDLTRRYELRVHVDMQNNDQISEGDYITDSSQPIVTGMEELDLQLTRVG